MSHRSFIFLTPLFILFVVGCDTHGKAKTEAKASAPATARVEIDQKVDPGMDASYLVDLAQVHARHKAPERALALFDQAREKQTDPELKAQIDVQRAEILQALQRPEEALAASNEAAKGMANNPDGRARIELRVGQVQRQNKQLDEAAKALDQAIQDTKDPNVREIASSELLQVWKAQGKLDEHVAALESKVQGDPKDHATLRLLGNAYGQAGKAEKAAEIFEKLTSAEPNEVTHYLTAGNYWAQAQKYPKSIEIYKKLFEKAAQPADKASACERIAYTYVGIQEFKDGEKWTEKLGSFAGANTAYVYAQQASLYRRMDMPEKAIAVLKKAIEVAPVSQQKEDFRYQLADAYVSMKRPGDAQPILEDLASNASVDPVKKNAIALLETLKKQDENK